MAGFRSNGGYRRASHGVSRLLSRKVHRVESLQQRFWPDPQPLVERLGREFFRQLPERPGVYLMRGAAEIVLYVGKAKSLRHRLGSYRVANPERMARRTLRLVSLVEQIVWEECESEKDALRRESELLLALKPRFNRAGVWQGPRRFLAWRAGPQGLELTVSDAPMGDWTCVGPFGAQVLHLHRALVRLIWCRFHPGAGLSGMPAGWFHGKHGLQVSLPHDDTSLIAGTCERLTRLAATGCSSFQDWLLPVSAPFERSVREEDVELVARHLGALGLAHEVSIG